MRESESLEASTLLRLDRLTLHNFRCFAHCSIELHPKLTVLVAENAQGKTAILDAIGLALDVFVTAITSGGNARGIDSDSVHLFRGAGTTMEPSLPTEFRAEGYADQEFVQWSRALTKSDTGARSSTKDTKMLCALAERLSSRANRFVASGTDSPLALPIVAFYGTGRLWRENRRTKGRKGSTFRLERFSAYLGCLSSSSSFEAFVAWYERAFNDLRSPTSKARGPEERLEKQIAAVHEAVRTALEPTGWTSIDWEFPPIGDDGRQQGSGFIVVEHQTRGRFPLSLLSDGVKNMVALVADLAYRCVRLNSHLGESAARRTSGIVMIDEVDMHLHPRWQQLVVELLQKAFPSMQMILTTHSPQVLSTVDSESIRLIRLEGGNATISKPRFQTRGIESADVLAQLMDVDPVPQVEEARWLSDYRAMVQIGEYESDSGRILWSELIHHFGAEHPVMSELDTLRRLQEFKLANSITPNSTS